MGSQARDKPRRRHAAARSRVVAGALSVSAFLAMTGGLAARHGATSSTTSTATSMAATPASSSSGTTAITSSHGS